MTPIHREWKIGGITFRFEPPDLLWSMIQGSCTQADAIRIVDLYRELGTARPFFLVGDMQGAQGMESEARRYISDHLQHQWLLGVIYFNSRLLHRALAEGLLLAAEMTRARKSPIRGKVHFVSTRAKAVALLAQLRAQHESERE